MGPMIVCDVKGKKIVVEDIDVSYEPANKLRMSSKAVQEKTIERDNNTLKNLELKGIGKPTRCKSKLFSKIVKVTII